MAVITSVRGPADWEAVYIDGDCVAQGHLGSVWPRDILNAIETETITQTETIRASPDGGRYVDTLGDADWYDGVLSDE